MEEDKKIVILNIEINTLTVRVVYLYGCTEYTLIYIKSVFYDLISELMEDLKRHLTYNNEME